MSKGCKKETTIYKPLFIFILLHNKLWNVGLKMLTTKCEIKTGDHLLQCSQ